MLLHTWSLSAQNVWSGRGDETVRIELLWKEYEQFKMIHRQIRCWSVQDNLLVQRDWKKQDCYGVGESREVLWRDKTLCGL